MHVRLLGGGSGDGGSPRLWTTDRSTFAVQGWKTDHTSQVEIPHRLLMFAEMGTCLTGLRDTGHGTFLVTGKLVTDAEALQIMKIPGHEAAIEVPIGREVMPDAAIPA
ncbi:hypothetical protein [Nocardia sp. CNY236]|uniref:hypothetical protein n=1 Tax=Nocardia sp. CNY236 TaxID=1169152 RepID=UPI00048B2B03|nr:hypothetical protein [Nocardia sp. CNY236]